MPLDHNLVATDQGHTFEIFWGLSGGCTLFLKACQAPGLPTSPQFPPCSDLPFQSVLQGAEMSCLPPPSKFLLFAVSLPNPSPSSPHHHCTPMTRQSTDGMKAAPASVHQERLIPKHSVHSSSTRGQGCHLLSLQLSVCVCVGVGGAGF